MFHKSNVTDVIGSVTSSPKQNPSSGYPLPKFVFFLIKSGK